MTTTEKTGARPYCNGSSPFAVNSKEDEARPSRNGSSSSQLTLEVFSGVGGSGRRPVSPPTPEGLGAWGAMSQPGVRGPGRRKVSFRRVGFRGVGQGAEVIKGVQVVPGARSRAVAAAGGRKVEKLTSP